MFCTLFVSKRKTGPWQQLDGAASLLAQSLILSQDNAGDRMFCNARRNQIEATVKNCGKYAYLLCCQELDEKIDTTLIFVH